MNTNSEEFIDSKIDNIIKENNIYHVGKVVRINSFVIEATGLEDAFFFEKVFVGDENNIGYVDKIEENKVFIALVKTNGNIKIGDSIKTTGEALEAGFSKNAMGMVVDAFGIDRMTGKSFNESKLIPIETEKIPIMDRTSVNRPLETGIASIDLMFPIGRGQRQLIIGDKKTGKTQILLDTIVNQKGKNVICIYVSIGKTKKEVKRLYSKLVEKGANAYTQIVAVFNDDTSPLIKLTPYVGLSIAEEYMRDGYDVLVCIDDLKKHADACREIALISEKNTGREAYPADIFYTHSRLLEKGCQYKNGGSITILPVVETKGGDITDYISTNIISITDGQIVLSEKNFKKGQKPALDYGLSVSRLGGAVQKDSIKKVGSAVRRELLTYLETADVYQLVKIDAMSKELQEKVFRGKKLLELLRQPKFAPRSEEKLIKNFSFILDSHSLGEDSKEEVKEENVNNNDVNNNDNNNNSGGSDNQVNVEETTDNNVENNEIKSDVPEENVNTEVDASVENEEQVEQQEVEVPQEVQAEEVPPMIEQETVETAQEFINNENVAVPVEQDGQQEVEMPQEVQAEETVEEESPVMINEETVEVPQIISETVNDISNDIPVIMDDTNVSMPQIVNEVESVNLNNEDAVMISEENYDEPQIIMESEPVIVSETVENNNDVNVDGVNNIDTTDVNINVENNVNMDALSTEEVVDDNNQDNSEMEELYTTEIPVNEINNAPEMEELYTTEIPVEEINNASETEELYTTEIPVEEINNVSETEQLLTTEIPVDQINNASETEELYTTEIPVEEINQVPETEELYTTEIPVDQINQVPETEELYTTEIPVDAINQVPETEQLLTTEIPVGEINSDNSVTEQLLTTEIPIVDNNNSNDLDLPVIENSYTTELPKLGDDSDNDVGKIINNNMNGFQSIPKITFSSNDKDNGVN